MIIKQKMIPLLNSQIRNEFAASAQYVAIAVHFDNDGLPDLANFFYRQAEEERMHAMKFVHFMLEAGAKPTIPDTPSLKNDFEGAADAVQYALTQEIEVTNQINALVTLAVEQNDHISNNFLQWFVDEQVEEVDSMSTLLRTIEHAGSNLLWVEDYVRRNLAAAATAESGGA
jgi:ferritin